MHSGEVKQGIFFLFHWKKYLKGRSLRVPSGVVGVGLRNVLSAVQHYERGRLVRPVVEGHVVVGAVGVGLHVKVLESQLDAVALAHPHRPAAVVVVVVHVGVVRAGDHAAWGGQKAAAA